MYRQLGHVGTLTLISVRLHGTSTDESQGGFGFEFVHDGSFGIGVYDLDASDHGVLA